MQFVFQHIFFVTLTNSLCTLLWGASLIKFLIRLVFGNVNLDRFSFQGFKRLKKHQAEVNFRQLTSYEWCSTADDPSCHFSLHSAESKEASVGASRDKLARGRGIPISIKFKKMANEVLSKHEELHRDHRHQNELGKTMREPPPIEIGPKRLKVRGPSVLGNEGRLN